MGDGAPNAQPASSADERSEQRELAVGVLVADPSSRELTRALAEVLPSELPAKVNVGDYLQLAWFVASMALVGGALGSLAEKDQAVREAAYRPRDAGQAEQDDDDEQQD